MTIVKFPLTAVISNRQIRRVPRESFMAEFIAGTESMHIERYQTPDPGDVSLTESSLLPDPEPASIGGTAPSLPEPSGPPRSNSPVTDLERRTRDAWAGRRALANSAGEVPEVSRCSTYP